MFTKLAKEQQSRWTFILWGEQQGIYNMILKGCKHNETPTYYIPP